MPILKGRRISKLRPEFVIMDPKTDGKTGVSKFISVTQKYCIYSSCLCIFKKSKG